MALIEVHTIDGYEDPVTVTASSLNTDHILGTSPAVATRPLERAKVLFRDGSELKVTETRTQLDRMINGNAKERTTGTRYVENHLPPDAGEDGQS